MVKGTARLNEKLFIEILDDEGFLITTVDMNLFIKDDIQGVDLRNKCRLCFERKA